jgi:hypothetical protein
MEDMDLKNRFRAGWGLVLLVLLVVPAVANGSMVGNGIDTWRTPGDGSSFVDFAQEPIPADFFCVGSEPFAGRITWQGQPLVTSPPNALGPADTIVQRLDDALFDEAGIAISRIQVRALSLVSREPIKTSCGLLNVRAMLAGEQPMTEIRLVQDGAKGGKFWAPLTLRVKLIFAPVSGSGESVELLREISSPGTPIRWTSEKPRAWGLLKTGDHYHKVSEYTAAPFLDHFVLVDTDGDQVVDTFLPGNSRSFFPTGSVDQSDKIATCDGPPGTSCHILSGTSCHCVYYSQAPGAAEEE